MGFLEHLEELRKRLIRGVIAILMASGVCIFFGERLFSLISAPIVALLPKDSSLIFTSLPDPFFTYLKTGFIAGFFVALPYVLYEVWNFIYPGLHKHERRMAAPFIIIATALFYAGGAFAYFLVFPAAFKFFLSYQTVDLKPMIAIREYVSLVLLLMLAFGAVFETPVVIVFLGLLGLFDSALLKKGRRYFVVLAFVIAAILTPTPDVVNQTLMAVPMLLFDEIGIWVLVIFEKKRERELAKEASEETE
ncbi:MAG: twin-arginine translocase subunit TatC [Desulfomonile tiedjei]|uniref:Sec-independent protein translocase protein TatC n=1 Tax=Desulfomonile tiedjei TaxID=2358 RepID=A0A9D6UXZ8_9BACT|nr:twin-arginine translocase subunit TatC [Desulfomonile tiedjei]